MSMEADKIISYQDLIDNVLNSILNMVQNKDGYTSNVPAELKPGFFRKDVISRSSGCPTVQQTAGVEYSLPSDTSLNIASTNTITTQFNAFLAERGIASKANSPITTKGIINFFNNISAFCSVKLILVTSQLTASKVLFYDQTASNYPTVPVQDNTVKITSLDIKNLMDNLNQTINNVSKLHIVHYTISTSSCSSSSSSSSSCSSCSSSSYIAYFNLN